jgi:hypothetical protein
MKRILVCLDCPEYQKGGYCLHKRKNVGALDNACEHSQDLKENAEPKAEEKVVEFKAAPETTKKCERCGEVLPLEQFEWYNYKGTNKRRRICSKCYHDAMKKNDRKDEGMKVCNGCHRELPLSEFYESANGRHSFLCKECARKYSVERTRKNREKKMAEMNAGATTKVCKSCGRELPLDAFGGHAKTWDKKATVCLECMRENLRKYVSKPKKMQAPEPERIVEREVMTDEQMVAALRANGWEVTCRKTVHLEL